MKFVLILLLLIGCQTPQEVCIERWGTEDQSKIDRCVERVKAARADAALEFSASQNSKRKGSKQPGCTSDYSCGVGQVCVKGVYETTGYCAKAVDSNKIPVYSAPNSDSIGPNLNRQCYVNTDCPAGFQCVSGNCVGH